MRSSLLSQFFVLLRLMQRDCTVLVRILPALFFESILWPIKFVVLYGYFMPTMGLDASYAGLMLISAILCVAFFAAFDLGNEILADWYIGDRMISFEFVLPLDPRLVLIRKTLITALRSMVIAAPLLPLGKLLLGQRFYAPNFHIVRSIIIFMLVNLFGGGLGIFAVGLVRRATNLYESKVSTLIWSMWELGAYQFTWHMLFIVSPVAAYLALINPFVYAMEGARAAVFGQVGYLNFWWCAGALLLSIILLVLGGVHLLLRRFDVVFRRRFSCGRR